MEILTHRNSATLYKKDGITPSFHASIGGKIHQEDGAVRTLNTMEEVEAWLRELQLPGHTWKYDGRGNWRRSAK